MIETRKLAAILAADIVGYGRLAGDDEERRSSPSRGPLPPNKAIMRNRPIFHSSDAAHPRPCLLLVPGALDAEASRRPRPPSRPRAGMEGAVARSRPPATGAHSLPTRQLAPARRRRARRGQAFQMRLCRPAVPRPPGPSTAATPVQIRPKTPRPPRRSATPT
jgi:hypothetical protein